MNGRILRTAALAFALLAIADPVSTFAALKANSIFRSINGASIATLDGVSYTNAFAHSSTNKGWQQWKREAESPAAPVASLMVKQQSTIASSESNFHFNATGGHFLKSELHGSSFVSNRATMTFITDEQSLVRVRSDMSDSNPSPIRVTVWSNDVVILIADPSGLRLYGNTVATNRQIFRFNLGPGRYVLDLESSVQISPTGPTPAVEEASYQFEFTAVDSRFVRTPSTSYIPRLSGRHSGRSSRDANFYYTQETTQIRWPLAAMRFDLLESPMMPRLSFTNPIPRPYKISNIPIESDGSNFMVTLPGHIDLGPVQFYHGENFGSLDPAWPTNALRLFQLVGPQ